MGVHAAPETSPFTWLSDEDVSWILSFLLTLSSLPTVAAVSCRLRAASRSPGAWEGALVDVPTRALADEQCMEMLAALCLSCWSRAKEVFTNITASHSSRWSYVLLSALFAGVY